MDIASLHRQFDLELRAVTGDADLRALRDRYLARKGGIASTLLKDVASAPADERRALGQAANEFKQHVEAAIENHLGQLSAAAREREQRANAVDVTLPGRAPLVGHRHPLTL